MFTSSALRFYCKHSALIPFSLGKFFSKCVVLTPSSSKQEYKSKQKFTVAVEGNIGSGKTTILKYFKDYSDVMVVEEPVSCWQNVDGLNLLNLMYSDPLKFSFSFQSFVQLTMFNLHLKSHTIGKNVKMIERSIYSAKYCFAENLFLNKLMSEPEYIVLSKWFDFLTEGGKVCLDLIVYLQANPETCFKNIQNRHRKEEMSIELEYLRNLHDLHEDWFMKQKFPVPCPVLVLPADCSMIELNNLCRKHAHTITFSGTDQYCNPAGHTTSLK